MKEDEICDGTQPYVDFFLSDVVFVILSVDDSGHIMLVGIACESFRPEVVFVQVLLEDLTR